MPPSWTEPVFRSLVPADRADEVIGDLLDEFRKGRRRQASAAGAQIWYATKVVGIFLEYYWLFPAVLTATFVANDLFNTFRDSTDVGRAAPDILGPALAAIFLSAGVYGGWRTQLMRGGIAASVATHAVTWMCMTLWWAITTYPFALSQRQSPYWIHAWKSSSQPGETFMHWIVWDNVGAVLLGGSMLLLFSVLMGTAGGTLGRALRRRRPPVPA